MNAHHDAMDKYYKEVRKKNNGRLVIAKKKAA
jgi:hypothetical protein